MVQILVSKVTSNVSIPVDIDNPEGSWEDVASPAINEVIKSIKTGETASVSGDDINITPDTIMSGGNLLFNIVEVEALPSDFKANAFLFDGTTWTTNTSYAKLTAVPSS